MNFLANPEEGDAATIKTTEIVIKIHKYFAVHPH